MEDLFTQALHLNSEGDYEKAYDLFISYYNYNPLCYESLGNAGLMKYNLMEYDSAIDIISKAIEIDPENPSNFFNRGLAYKQLKKYSEALSDLEQSLSIEPNNSQAIIEVNWINDLIEKEPISIDFDLFNSFVDIPGFNEFKYGQKSLNEENYILALKYFNNAIELNSSDQHFYFERAQCYLKMKEYFEAKNDFTRSYNLGNKDALYWVEKCKNNFDNFHQFETKRMKNVSQLIASKDWSRVITETSFVIDRYLIHDNEFCFIVLGNYYPISICITAYNARGMSSICLGNYVEGIKDFDKVINYTSDKTMLGFSLSLRATAKFYLKDYIESINDFTQAIHEGYSNNNLYLKRGQAYEKARFKEKAINDYKKAIEMGNKEASVSVSYTHLTLPTSDLV